MKNGENVCLDKISSEFESGSQGQILEKPCLCYRGHIFGPITMKLCQNVSLDEISDDFENGSYQVKN